MSSKIKVDTIENVAGSGNVSLGSGHNLVVPGDLTVDTNNLFVDASAEKVFVNRTTQTKNTDAFVVSSPASGVGGGNNRVDMTVTAQDLTGDSGANANAFVTTKAKGIYYSGLEISSTDGHVGGFIGNYGADAASRKLEVRVGGSGINAGGDVEAMRVDASGRITKPQAVYFLATGNDNNYIQTSPVPFPTVVANIGSHYNNSNYTFTAPVAGRYFLHAHMGLLNGSSGQNIYPWFNVNGTNQQYSYANVSATWYMTGSITTILSLSANDTVKITVSAGGGGTYYNGANETRFMGYLLG